MSHPLLCATVIAGSNEGLRRQRDEAAAFADLVELRLDRIERPDVAALLAGRQSPVIVTCRPRWEGGEFDGPEEVRLRLLRHAMDLGAEYVDVEWRAEHQPIVGRSAGRGVVLSLHDFQRTPADVPGLYAAMRATGAEVVKLAVTANSLADALPLLDLGREVNRSGERAVLIGMGESGAVTRIVPERFGSCWSYAGASVAPGQLDGARLRREFRYGETGASTRLFGVVGRPVTHSLSPVMHNAAFRARGVDAVYLPLETDDADDFLAFAAAIGLSGASVTSPLKVALFERASSVDEVSRRVGAVNTLRFQGSALEGCNTDVAGFLAPLDGVPLDGRRAAVVGAGGAARAAAVGLASRGARVAVYARHADRAAAVAALCGGRSSAGTPPAGSWDLLVNATPVGMAAGAGATPVPAQALGGGVVYDLVYSPARTRLLREAEEAGCAVVGGLGMLVAQAALQFTWWTGQRAPVDLMREQALARLMTTAGGE